MKIRKAIKKDLENIYPLFLGLVESEEKFSKKAVSFFAELNKRKKTFEKNSRIELLKDIENKNSLLFIVEENNNIIGYVSGNLVDSKNPFYESKVLGYFKHMFILKEHQGKGISKKLLDELEKWFIEKKCKFIYGEVFSTNYAVKVFKKFGYHPVTYKIWKKLK
ncbi:MAG: GNAT family N-acetyltransferase [Nanoarchaeota archaeon]|nr:GNAT family N-acetyltransferase [Nanoarchaeota archaeon]